jgi:hypothetical protein
MGNTQNRITVREMARQSLEQGDGMAWFELLYARAQQDTTQIPWADLVPNPNLLDWLNRDPLPRSDSPLVPRLALVIGSGLGDDAEALAHRGFATTAFDISASAIAWSQKRFPTSTVFYVAADLFAAPQQWQGQFDFVLESYTLQALPSNLRAKAYPCIAAFLAPGGTLLVIARGREPSEPEGHIPWPLTLADLSQFETYGLQQVSLEDYWDQEDPPVRRFRVTYVKP